MEKKFIRTEMLLGNKAMEKLKNSKIAIFGIGGCRIICCRKFSKMWCL